MPAALTFFFVMIMTVYSAMNATQQDVARTNATADVSATNVIAYKASLVKYLNVNTTASGNIVDASLTMPTGLVRDTNWTNSVVGGTLFVYEATPSTTSNVLENIYAKTDKSIMVGRSNGTNLINARGFNTGIAIPATTPPIPTGSIVMVGK